MSFMGEVWILCAATHSQSIRFFRLDEVQESQTLESQTLTCLHDLPNDYDSWYRPNDCGLWGQECYHLILYCYTM